MGPIRLKPDATRDPDAARGYEPLGSETVVGAGFSRLSRAVYMNLSTRAPTMRR